ncbi:hypothetical protein [Ottowia thiooxydans]|uniref:hypothetical protein n=1 Tax=Ottowia thiooxydans TaxID=219182 RepID=UPI000408D153|nr:hypothetical protein [Ottowia thiooxydans]
MLSEDSSPSDPDIQQVLRHAERVLVEAKAKREASGLGEADAREKLERQLSQEDIAEVHAAIQAKLAGFQREAKTRAQRTVASPPKARPPRPMV